ncbi:maltokinase N-terminal cap-like domain-containing protein [Amnibacterium endophyticum]|uniref:Maltokinase n=1 Tax=Amnibacterium endophyticum TaxID=2109337 RepID=A0ABW4LGS8_9MICO
MPDSTSVDGPLRSWIGGQRWFASTGTPDLVEAGEFPIASDGSGRTLLLRERSGDALYQVPVVLRDADGQPGVIGAVDGGELIDGPRDASYVRALLELVLGGGQVEGDGTTVRGVPLGWEGPAPTLVASRVLSGEQSNTSIIVEATRDDGEIARVMLKVFRALHDGENPDVVLQSAIAAAGSDRVPATWGALVGTWPDASVEGGLASGHLAVAQEYLPGTEDAWRVALVAARAGEDFTGPARDLGAATAEVHRVLAQAFPTRDADEAGREALLASMRGRAKRAIGLVPGLAGRAEEIEEALVSGTRNEWPALQRVHGDYHLGQVLLVPDRGWVLLDFEGEPLRPMAERSEPDAALRDVAGMLRSFDYVAGTIALEGGDAAAANAWTASVRAAFLEGYERELGRSLDPYAALLTALELDKALYECEYEVRNRPLWLPIPEDAVHRMLEARA